MGVENEREIREFQELIHTAQARFIMLHTVLHAVYQPLCQKALTDAARRC